MLKTIPYYTTLHYTTLYMVIQLYIIIYIYYYIFYSSNTSFKSSFISIVHDPRINIRCPQETRRSGSGFRPQLRLPEVHQLHQFLSLRFNGYSVRFHRVLFTRTTPHLLRFHGGYMGFIGNPSMEFLAGNMIYRS